MVYHLTLVYIVFLKKTIKKIYLFTGSAGSSLLCSFSLATVSRGYSLVAVRRLLIAVASLIAEHRF